jgi:uncharacterized protein YbaR (Trm112 family)
MKHGDIVSYNFSASCTTHLYHHSCIKEWLLHHVSCPACRQTYLPIDETCHASGKETLTFHLRPFTKPHHRHLSGERSLWINRTFICEKSGLVVVESAAHAASATVLESRKDPDGNIGPILDWIRQSCPTVKQQELIKLRGGGAIERKAFSSDVGDEGDNQEVGVVDLLMGVEQEGSIDHG